MRRSFLALMLIGSAAFMACGEQTSAPVDDTASFRKVKAGSASLLSNIPIAEGGVTGTLSITRIDVDPVTRELLFSGTVTRTADGVTEAFSGVTGTLTESAASSSALVVQQVGPNEPGACDILFLDLGPLHLDLLGVVLDLNPVVLDLDAVASGGALLGNLLCAVTGLLDGVSLSGVTALLTQINTLLGSLL